MKLIFAIPSYDRADRQLFLAYLKRLGYTRDSIYISTQCDRDRDAYTARYGADAHIIYRPGSNVCDNKNTLADTLSDSGAHVVFVSDKVKGVQYLAKGGKVVRTIETRELLERFIAYGYAMAERNRCQVWGVYPTNNAYFMDQSASVDKMLLGCFMGFRPGFRLRFDPAFPLKEDFELSLRVIRDGGHTLRFNNICLDATFHTKGGCHAMWNSEGDKVNAACCKRMLEKYGDLVALHATRKNELRYKGKSRNIKL